MESLQLPICVHCRRSKITCVYEPYSVNVADRRVKAPPPRRAHNHVLSSLIDTYFTHVHNQPYSYFHEPSFRGHGYPFSDLVSDDDMNLHVVQAVNMLAVVGHTAGRINLGWVKLGLAARISQGMGLMREPDCWLPVTEQEKRRRVFWSVYLLDKLISCGQSKPVVILDKDCQLHLPCTEEGFKNGEAQTTSTVEKMLSWNAELTRVPSPFALVLPLASNIGRCTRHMYWNSEDDIPPWDTQSEYSAITSTLLLFESYVEMDAPRPSDPDSPTQDSASDHQEVERQTYAHTVYHLCHCLLNHPFLIHLRCQPLRSKIPRSFATRSLQAAVDHATLLVETLVSASQAGTLIESSSYAYCIVIAGTIHSIASHAEAQIHSTS
ncbi:hypothetical protein BDW75DRAFT_235715 [Aspergillus navahoensis]